jgi:hypothetical protein
MMKPIKRKKRGKPGTLITVYISFDAYDKLEELCEIYNKSRSKMIEKIILVFYKAIKEEDTAEEQTTTPKEATAEAQ